MRSFRKALISVTLAAAGVAFVASPASAADFACDLTLAEINVDIAIAASGPASVVVGETNRYNLDLDMSGVIPPDFAALSGTATKVVASLPLPSGVEVDPATATVTGVDGATVSVNGDKAEVTVPGPIPFGGGAQLPSLTVSIDVKASQAGEIVLTTEGASALLEAEAALTPDAAPIPITATCVSGTPETLLTVSVTDVAGATQTAAPNVQTSSATASPAAMATTGSESVVLSGVALLLMGFGMLAVAGQRSLAHRRS